MSSRKRGDHPARAKKRKTWRKLAQRRAEQPDLPAVLTPQGVFEPRTPRPPSSDLINPRAPLWDDLISAARRRLLEASRRRANGQPLGPDDALPVKVLDVSTERMSQSVYRYTKGPDFTNDELGYGEVVTEVFWKVERGAPGELPKASAKVLKSQRTRTGRQLLREESAAELPPVVQPPKPPQKLLRASRAPTRR